MGGWCRGVNAAAGTGVCRWALPAGGGRRGDDRRGTCRGPAFNPQSRTERRDHTSNARVVAHDEIAREATRVVTIEVARRETHTNNGALGVIGALYGGGIL